MTDKEHEDGISPSAAEGERWAAYDERVRLYGCEICALLSGSKEVPGLSPDEDEAGDDES